jgi:L,D-transpeptidase ErfK/SrfK
LDSPLNQATSRKRFATALGCICAAAAVLVLTLAPRASAQELPRIANQLSGSDFLYAVKPKDTIVSIGSRYGVGPSVLAASNALETSARIKPGDVLQIDNRHVVPRELDDGVVINVPQRMLFLFADGKLVSSYPVALGRPTWPTSTGRFRVIEKREHPTWHVPASIQREMEEEGKDVIDSVEPGPDNPLGDYWVGLNLGGYGIHSTNVPLSIYGFRTHGCIRLHPDDAAGLFKQVKIGEHGRIIYAPVLMAALDDGRVFVEVHRDIYKKSCPAMVAIHTLADSNHLANMIDWSRVSEIANSREGLARDISLKSDRK